MAIADVSGLPVSIWATGASTHEVKLVEKTINAKSVRKNPKRIIGDKAYDSDKMDKRLRKRRIEFIAPHRSNRRKSKTQDGRKLRRYCKRWKIERLFACIQNFRKCVVRYEYHIENYFGFIQLACIIILIRHF